MAEYGHVLHFQARNLTHREEEKVRTHFQIKRISGGGECGPVEKVEGSTYKIGFKSKEDQERVLQRKFHTVPLPDGELRLTVSRGLPRHSLDHQVGAAAAPPPSQAFEKTNTKCLEKTFPLDVFLLLYLRDNERASKLLKKQLSFIGCKVDVNLDEETAVVSGDVTKGPRGAFGGAAERWEELVDRVLISFTENYKTHHCVDAKERKVLLQEPSLVGDEVKVYMEAGYPVIVGEVEAVRERVAILKKSLPVRKEVPVAEQKFKMVEQEFSREMAMCHPGVKFSSSPNLVVLEGSEQDVKSGEAKLDELTKKVQQMRVQLQPALISFVTSSGAAAKYQTRFQQSLRRPVSIEVDSDLVLSSLSTDALAEAKAMLVRDLSLVTVQLDGAAASPPNLDRVRDILTQAKTQENRHELRVESSFVPGNQISKVQLVGYTENVSKLKSLLQDFKMNQVSTQEDLPLTVPQLVDCFDELLKLAGLKLTVVTVKASHSPSPHVTLTGPYCKVQEAKRAIISVFSSLTVDTVVLEGTGAQRYFQGEGKVSKGLVERSCEVIILEEPSVQAPTRPRSLTTPISPTARPQPVRSHAASVGGSASYAGSHHIDKVNVVVKLCSMEEEQVHVLVVPMINKQMTSTNIGFDLSKKAGNGLKLKFDSVAASCTVAPGDILQVYGPPTLGCSKIFFMECLPWDGVQGRSVQCCCDVFQHLSDNMNQGGQAIFRSLTSDLDDITIQLMGGLKLRLVFGDITGETTDVVVNSTDFENFDIAGVSKDILTLAGPAVEAQLKAVQHVTTGSIVKTAPGLFPCKAILHVCGKKSANVIEGLVQSIIDQCESHGFKSVAIPAICAGVGGLQPDVVAGAILRGLKTSTNVPLHVVSDIRIIMNKVEVFLAFKEEAMQIFSTFVISRGDTLAAPASSQVHQPGALRSAPAPADLSVLDHSAPGQQSTFLVVGLSTKSVHDGMAKFRDQYETQCSTQSFQKEELEDLSTENLDQLLQLLDSEGLYARRDPAGSLTVRGLKDGVSQTAGLIAKCLRGRLKNDLRLREEKDLSTRVVWCIMGHNGNWEQLPPAANFSLENRDLTRGIVDARGTTWTVDLRNMEAKSLVSAQPRKLKRQESLPDFILPLYWDNMAAGETMKVVTLQPSSSEFKTLKKDFVRTAADKTVLKIERLQNIHLRRGYDGRKKQISDKNAVDTGGANEKILYHGTTQDNSKSIMKTGFDRRFCGQNGTSFGDGVYFAVNAKYSAHPNYSKPAADGSQLMFVARVLTGTFTRGQSGMKVPPLRDSQRPDDRFDSVVDQPNQPGMYVVFHDNQSYPDYLITFK